MYPGQQWQNQQQQPPQPGASSMPNGPPPPYSPYPQAPVPPRPTGLFGFSPQPHQPAPPNNNQNYQQPYMPPPQNPIYPPQPPVQQQYTPSAYGQQQQPQQQYIAPFTSPCNGRKKALLIGINYFNQRGQLSGCINDVKNIKRFLIQTYGFVDSKDTMVTLTDDQRDPYFIPTRQNIINAMRWLVGDARPGDSLVFHFSGHGGQAKDKDGDEDDGYDETILPVDFSRSGQIVDDEMHAIMVRNLPQGVRMLAIFDSCHSGTALDLPFQYLPDGTLKQKTLANTAGSSLKDMATSYLKGGIIHGGLALIQGVNRITNLDKAKKKTEATRMTRADVVSLSGCKDRQTSADTSIKGIGATGAMSYALIRTLSANPRPTYGQLLGGIREILRREYSQIPQLSCGKLMNMNEPFLV